MVREIRWTFEAIETFENIIEYLEYKWTEKEIENFVRNTDKIIRYISQNPKMFRKSHKFNIHEAVISKHNILIYKTYPTHIDLITFWDTRQDPKKLKI